MEWNVMDMRNSLVHSCTKEMAGNRPSFHATALNAFCNHEVGLRFQRYQWNPITFSVSYPMRWIVSFPFPGILCT